MLISESDPAVPSADDSIIPRTEIEPIEGYHSSSDIIRQLRRYFHAFEAHTIPQHEVRYVHFSNGGMTPERQENIAWKTQKLQ